MSSPLFEIDEIAALYQAGDSSHDFDHVLRVRDLALHIASAEDADKMVVEAAALLHDVPLPDHGRSKHHLASAEYAGRFLMQKGMDPQRVQNVVHAISAHRFRDQSIQPQTLEAKVLYDADKLDSIGAIGVARAFAFAGRFGERLWNQPWRAAPDEPPVGADYTPVHEFVYKLRKILPSLHTESARAIGYERHRFMTDFFDGLDAEMERFR